ncbi:hypothetical protein Bca52824_040852 [Brassica carinata]|uniref:Uncharacterized protein n=1 Tax=Brassica carinata TaxID=52824 RepID=A0A8X7RVJ6_BRACI|nr:hypothetical protein Bca52824_040852 [Brassica carinata]
MVSPMAHTRREENLFLCRTHVNLVIMVHEKQYSLEELQTMVDDMDYGLRSEPLVGGCFEYNIGMGLKSEDLCNEGEKAVPYDYLDMSSGSDWDQVFKKVEEEFH